MGLRVHIPSDPTGLDPGASILASCDGSRELEQELRRYCSGELDGRSFLVAGLRGSGKTWLVENAVGELQHGSGAATRMRALRVSVQGPHIFEVLDEPPREPSSATTPATAQQGAHASVSLTVNRGRTAPPASPLASSVDEARDALHRQAQRRRLFQHVLETVVFSLHSALSAEFVRRFREIARQRDDARLHELAAALEISLPEGPSPAEMRAFWHSADALERGVLFPGRKLAGRGMRELSALSGMSYAYKRVAGEVQAKFSEQQSASDTHESSGQQWATQIGDLAKPLTAVLAGAFVTAGAAVKQDLLPAALLGMATAAVAAIVLRLSSKRIRHDEDKRDLTFLPKTDAASLERVLPELIRRLKVAGLAPVIVVDELDKVENLWDKLTTYGLLDHFKKLFAEQVFTCLLVNRSFMEELTIRERADPYASFHSYFSRRVLVSFEPAEVHDYLEKLIEPFRG